MCTSGKTHTRTYMANILRYLYMFTSKNGCAPKHVHVQDTTGGVYVFVQIQ